MLLANVKSVFPEGLDVGSISFPHAGEIRGKPPNR